MHMCLLRACQLFGADKQLPASKQLCWPAAELDGFLQSLTAVWPA
jgi:hypothetical protein